MMLLKQPHSCSAVGSRAHRRQPPGTASLSANTSVKATAQNDVTPAEQLHKANKCLNLLTARSHEPQRKH